MVGSHSLSNGISSGRRLLRRPELAYASLVERRSKIRVSQSGIREMNAYPKSGGIRYPRKIVGKCRACREPVRREDAVWIRNGRYVNRLAHKGACADKVAAEEGQ